jgi:hypothetical protein
MSWGVVNNRQKAQTGAYISVKRTNFAICGGKVPDNRLLLKRSIVKAFTAASNFPLTLVQSYVNVNVSMFNVQ